jgi:hypothetical protein
MLSIVYFYAGLAKLNSDWLLHAQPLSIWLPAKAHLPIIGPWLRETWVHYLFSWAGAAYDLFIPFLLWSARTRPLALVTVVVFHLLTRILFPIGMFPYLMIGASLIFCRPDWHARVLARLGQLLGSTPAVLGPGSWRPRPWLPRLLGVVLFLQLVLPFRYLLYPGELFWTEQGYRFSWRVMLMEKTGYAQFRIVDGATGREFRVDNSQFLTPLQEKQMAFQPDFILEYAHHLADHFREQEIHEPQVYVESYVALNGRPSRPYIDPEANLLNYQPSLRHKDWILPYPYEDEIKGF